MLQCAKVVLLVALCWGVASAEPEADEDVPDTNECAVTEVLVAMKKLLLLLSTEVRDLREQVKNSCQASVAAAPSATVRPITVTELVEKQESADSEEATTKPEPDDFIDFALEVEEPEDVDYNLTDSETNPISEFAEGIGNWWGTFSLFPPKPTTTEVTPTDEPEETDQEEDDEEEEYITEEGEEEEEEEEEQEEDVKTRAPKLTTSTTTTSRPYTVPPPPTSCPSPFSLLAQGCYMLVHNGRDWRTWGDAFAFCQSYGGRLASPWRLEQLQDYLIRFYSDAFWVGARLVPTKRRWEWLTGRSMERGEWKPGQPNRNPGKKCVFLDKWSGYHANNFFCGEKHPFICESI